MGRNRKVFTEEEMHMLASNPYTLRITETTIRYTLAFKEEFMRRYKDGYSPKQIMLDLGYDVNILGMRRVEGLRDHLVKESLSAAGLHEGTLQTKIRPYSRDYTQLPQGKAIEYMQHELLYLRQEVEFLKKIIAADNEAKRRK
ncbi:MAG: hypothetical protein EOM28_13235 [Clostridia bacterium]|nr:hypothetical protein [Clostridia bacterium]